MGAHRRPLGEWPERATGHASQAFPSPNFLLTSESTSGIPAHERLINRYSTLFELSDLKNSLKSLGSAGIAIEGPSQEFGIAPRPDGITITQPHRPDPPIARRKTACGPAGSHPSAPQASRP